MLSDKLQKFIFENSPIKGSLVHLHSSWQELCSNANPPQDLSYLLAEVVSSSVLLTSNIKFKGAVSLQIQSEGRVGLVLGQCTDQQLVRGVARVRGDRGAPILENPVLSINLEPAGGGAAYQGVVAFPDGSVAKALEEYFLRSEQLETRIWLAVGDQCCSGLMLQKMPGQEMDEDDWNRLTALASTVSDEELLGLEANSLLNRLFFEDRVRLFDPLPVNFGCQCSKARVGEMLRGLGESEATSIIEEQGEIEVRCEYCGQTYQFDPVDTAQLFLAEEQISAKSPSVQ